MTTVDDAVLTPAARTVVRRSLFWVGVAAFALLIAIIMAFTVGRSVGGQEISPSNAAPQGAMAVAEVLGDQGVDVIETASLADTRDAIADPARTTLFVVDTGYLDDEQWRDAVGLATRVIVAEPGFGDLQAIAPGVAQAGGASARLEADCDLGPVQRAGTVTGPASGYRIVDEQLDATGCLGSGDDVFSLVQLATDSGELLILGATGALTNEWAAADGNAAFALGLLGERETLVWYLPGFEDVQDAPVTAGDLTPAWVTPVLVLLVLTFVAAAVWRGRRMGPLVIENLPVTVRASETMHGRARLYERSSARLRALDALRVGSIERIAQVCGLPRTADVGEVAMAAAALIGRPLANVRALLVDAVPGSDADLLRLSDELLVLEQTVTEAIRP
jgi:hypothetical protein